jgi:hypothetical protein
MVSFTDSRIAIVADFTFCWRPIGQTYVALLFTVLYTAVALAVFTFSVSEITFTSGSHLLAAFACGPLFISH